MPKLLWIQKGQERKLFVVTKAVGNLGYAWDTLPAISCNLLRSTWKRHPFFLLAPMLSNGTGHTGYEELQSAAIACDL